MATTEPVETYQVRDVSRMNLAELATDVSWCTRQFIAIHNLPKVDKQKPGEYMLYALEGVRNRCIELNWQCCKILAEWQAHLRKGGKLSAQKFSEKRLETK